MNITIMTIVYDTQIILCRWGFKATNITGGGGAPSCMVFSHSSLNDQHSSSILGEGHSWGYDVEFSLELTDDCRLGGLSMIKHPIKELEKMMINHTLFFSIDDSAQ